MCLKRSWIHTIPVMGLGNHDDGIWLDSNHPSTRNPPPPPPSLSPPLYSSKRNLDKKILKHYKKYTEYTQSGNCSFLAYIPSWWKNQPSLVRAGDASPPLFTISTITYRVVVSYAPAERADIWSPYFYFTPTCNLCLCQYSNECTVAKFIVPDCMGVKLTPA